MTMADIDKLLARAQVGLAFLVAGGFLLILTVLLFHSTQLTQPVVGIATSLLGVLGTIFTLQMNYFFARHRPQSLPEPNGSGVSQPSNPTSPVTPAPSSESKS